MKIHVFGYPSDVGGASTELWHLIRLWRRHGCEVSLVPTWSAPRGWPEKTTAIGCETLRLDRRGVSLPDGSIVVSLCNAPFLEASQRLRNCRLIYLPCMNYLNEPLESQTYLRDGPFDAYVMQSAFQLQTLQPMLAAAGVPAERLHLIRGAFLAEDFPFNPCHRQDVFSFGRLSRPDPRKFIADWWDFCNAVRERIGTGPVSVACRTMGWDANVARKCGPPPAWCEAMPKCEEPIAEFLGTLDVLVQLGDVDENWPRVGLEAIAAGVPIVADRRGGWREMIEHGRTGFLVGDRAEVIECVTRLFEDEPLRLEIATRARRELVENLADEELIWDQWRDLFEAI
jgi:glycosyltransferase involved in cell wall biosynthesis